jgi:hypothetical protein
LGKISKNLTSIWDSKVKWSLPVHWIYDQLQERQQMSDCEVHATFSSANSTTTMI